MDSLIDALLAARSASELPGRVLQTIAEIHSWDFGAWWTLQDNRGALEPAAIWSRDASMAEFEAATRSRTFALGGGLPGRVWLEQQPIAIPDVTVDEYFPKAIAAARGGVHGAVAFPVTVEGDVRAVLEFFWTGDGAIKSDTLNALNIWGQRIGLALERLGSADRLAHAQRVSSLQRIPRRRQQAQAIYEPRCPIALARLCDISMPLLRAFGPSTPATTRLFYRPVRACTRI